MLIRPILFALAMAASCSLQAATVNVTVRGIDYEVGTIEGAFNDPDFFANVIQEQIWWNGEMLAREFAEAVGTQLGFVNNGFFGPMFAWGTQDFDSGIYVAATLAATDPPEIRSTDPQQAYRIFATATEISAVPLPGAAWLFLSAIAGGLGLQRFRRQAT